MLPDMRGIPRVPRLRALSPWLWIEESVSRIVRQGSQLATQSADLCNLLCFGAQVPEGVQDKPVGLQEYVQGGETGCFGVYKVRSQTNFIILYNFFIQFFSCFRDSHHLPDSLFNFPEHLEGCEFCQKFEARVQMPPVGSLFLNKTMLLASSVPDP